ncbi:MAG: glycosyltransferase family 2 protein [Burkholderiales bacterium]|nr:glycosyltransferase family 2 protein [Burkholderiales bacterium]
MHNITIVIPARNEAVPLAALLPEVRRQVPEAEIIVVDDGSSDETASVAAAAGVRVLPHPYPMGNGAAIKTGARAARGKIIVFMDGDGQHRAEDIPSLLEKVAVGYDMAVGARVRDSHAGTHRAIANDVFSRFASWMVMQRIDDLTSGFRAVRADKFRQFLYLLPNGFSYPTTITISFFRAGYSVAYVPIRALPRHGKSHIRPLRDGVRFLLIIIKIGTLFSPLKLFLPVSGGFFLTGITYYAYTYFTSGRFTNMSALLFISAILTFLIGIVSEQISSLHYRDLGNDVNGANDHSE